MLFIGFMHSYMQNYYKQQQKKNNSYFTSQSRLPTVTSLVSSLDLHLDKYVIDALNIIWVCHVCPYMYEQPHE